MNLRLREQQNRRTDDLFPPIALPAPGADLVPDVLHQERERVLQALGIHFAHDDLSLAELDERMDRAVRARSHGQLEALLEGLPPLARKFDSRSEPTSARMVGVDDVPPRGVVMAMLSGAERKGRWLVPRHMKVWAFMGGVEVDFRQARFAPGVTEIEITAIMGAVEVLVPPDVTVECTGLAFAGGFSATTGDADDFDPSRPILRISGMACMGGVEAKVKEPKAGKLSKFEKRLARIRKGAK
jgi:hypothetical protein